MKKSSRSKVNLVYRQELYERILQRAPDFPEVCQQLGQLYARQGRYLDCLRIDQNWRRARPQDPLAYYNLACDYALLHDPDMSLACLEIAFLLGYRDRRQLEKDPELENVRGHPRFRILLRRYFPQPNRRR
ncbi:MAG TPA: hypothetical protein PKX93_08640 [bacterium]|nr:hypothetical protein [bacterium]HPP12025.1 hypothetical protein [bacterium]